MDDGLRRIAIRRYDAYSEGASLARLRQAMAGKPAALQSPLRSLRNRCVAAWN